MRKILFFLMLSIFVSGCSKDRVDFIFDKEPEERVKEKLEALQAALVDAPYGWKAAVDTKVGGGYGFYIDFNKDHTLRMLSDFSSSTSGKLKESTYRVTWTMDAVLMFDTYSYLTLLQDPTPSVNGGTAGNGLQSDIEFEFIYNSADTLRFKGKRYAQTLTLVKLTEAQQNAYLADRLTTSIAEVNNYFSTHANNYIEVSGIDNKVEVVLTSNKFVNLQYIDNNGKLATSKGKYNFELTGVNFNTPIILNQDTLIRAVLDNNVLNLVNSKGQRYQVNQNVVPILPIINVFAYNKTYNALYIGLALPNGIESEFNTTYQKSVDAFAAMTPGRQILQCYFRLSSSTKAELVVQNQVLPAGSAYLAFATYDYKMDDNGVITLSNPTYDSNFTARMLQLAPLRDYFLTGSFKLMYVNSSDPSVTNVGGLAPLDAPANFFYGQLRKL